MKKFAKVLEKFDRHFDVRKNVIFERARFNKRNQLDGETAEEYITALYGLVESCEYGALKEEMLRDRLVVGIRDSTVSQKLQMNAKLTLEEAKKEIRQREAVREQSKQLRTVVTTAAWERSEDPDHHVVEAAPRTTPGEAPPRRQMPSHNSHLSQVQKKRSLPITMFF